MNHAFTETIVYVLIEMYGPEGAQLLDNSLLLQYLNKKTKSANRGSKSRSSFGNHYAMYVLIEDYILKGFLDANKGKYSHYEGARFTELFRRQRELPFGSRLQNHALNSRLNEEFAKYFPMSELRPIIRQLSEQRYWINEALLKVPLNTSAGRHEVNIAKAIIEIIHRYIAAKKSAFEQFISASLAIAALTSENAQGATDFIASQLKPNVDARIFEIVSFAILKSYYGEQSIYWGWSADVLRRDFLMLYKTGRTNANDGGIDFVMKPLGRFFQVTETIDVNKYFLDIDKVHRFPMTFVIKSNDSETEIRTRLRVDAQAKYGIDAVVNQYMEAVDEVFNIPTLLDIFTKLVHAGKLRAIMDEIVLQSRVEFDLDEDDDEVSDGVVGV